MRATSLPRRARRIVAGGTLTAALATALLAAGCTAGNGADRVSDRTRLVDGLANRLANASALTYTADYELAGGGTGSIAQTQKPHQASYRYPGGLLLVTTKAVTDCRTRDGGTTCTLKPPPSPGVDASTALLGQMAARGLMVPPTVIGLLTAAAVDPNAVIEQHDSTLAGRHATCVHATGVDNAAASEFSACITADGVLGSFVGTVSGSPVDVQLVRYEQTADPAAFTIPSGATVRGTPTPTD